VPKVPTPPASRSFYSPDSPQILVHVHSLPYRGGFLYYLVQISNILFCGTRRGQQGINPRDFVPPVSIGAIPLAPLLRDAQVHIQRIPDAERAEVGFTQPRFHVFCRDTNKETVVHKQPLSSFPFRRSGDGKVCISPLRSAVGEFKESTSCVHTVYSG